MFAFVVLDFFCTKARDRLGKKCLRNDIFCVGLVGYKMLTQSISHRMELQELV